MIMNFDLFIDFVVFAYELFDGVLFDHIEDVPFGVEIASIDVHNFKY